jgi:hypothetical protein
MTHFASRVTPRELFMKRFKCLLLFSLLGLASMQAGAACFTVFDGANRVIYHSATPPVDMERPFHETVPQRFPGGHMIVSDPECQPLAMRAPVTPAGGAAPLLTDKATAQAMKVPYRVLSGDVVMVPQGRAPIGPGLTVVPAGPQAAATMKPAHVITELRDPPVVIEESTAGMAYRERSR